VAEAESNASEVENPSNPANYSERVRRGDNARAVADLEDQFPEEDFNFMEEQGISRKKKSTKHGSVSQIVENVYAEDEDMSVDHEERSADNPKMRNPRMQPGKVDYAEDHGPVSDKKNPRPGKVKFGTHPEKEVEKDGTEGRYDTGKSSEQAEDRYKTGKASDEDVTNGRFEIARGKEQHDAGRPAAKNNGIEEDRRKTGRYVDPDDEGRYDEMSRDQMYNNDVYDDDVDYGVNDAETASGSNPAGRVDGETKVPTETEEMPDDEIFAVGMENVTKAKNARVMQIKSGQKMPHSHGGGIPGSVMADYAEPEPAEVTGKSGVYAEGKKKILSGEFEGGPDEMTLKTGGVYSESYKGEAKSSKKALTPGAFDSDEDDEPAEKTGPSGVTGGADHGEMPEAFKKNVAKMKGKKKGEEEMASEHAEGLEAQAGVQKSKKDMLSGEFDGGVAEETGPSGVSTGYAEHKKDQNPYTETGFGSTYKEDDEDMDDEFCDMGKNKPMGRNYKESEEFSEFYAELQALKAENARIKQEYREAQVAHRREQIHSFVEGLYETGKMVDSIIPERKLMEFAEGLEFGTLEFSEGETATSILFTILDKLPNLVDFSEYAGGSMKFVDEADLDPHQRALSMVEKSGGEMDYVEALKKAMYS
jgi:hypothetical protein